MDMVQGSIERRVKQLEDRLMPEEIKGPYQNKTVSEEWLKEFDRMFKEYLEEYREKYGEEGFKEFCNMFEEHYEKYGWPNEPARAKS
jgi:hypothetical protein